MSRGAGLALSLLAVAAFAGGCGFAKEARDGKGSEGFGFFGWNDPYHDSMAEVNFEFTHNPLPMYPTMVGNVVGVIAFLPLTAITGAFGSPHDDPHSYFEYAASASAYFGGALVGGPFELLNLVFVRWWYDWAFPPDTGGRQP